MQFLETFLQFISIPALLLVVSLIAYRGEARGYKIVKETNTLGEEKFEVWIRYKAVHKRCWRKELTCDTENEANQFIARLFTIRTVIREGGLENSVIAK